SPMATIMLIPKEQITGHLPKYLLKHLEAPTCPDHTSAVACRVNFHQNWTPCPL
ncbi:hypothetical protein CSKR_201422, partial [Clonorchis sinensis]